MCYTFCDRWCRKGDAALLSRPFPATAEQTDFGSLRDENCVDAIKRGVQKVFIMDGRVPHSILIETLTDEGIGTMFFKRGDCEVTE